jgi:hypothetical protein
VDGSFVIAKDRQVSFRLGTYDRSRQLIIDPMFDFIGALGSGGGGNTQAYGMTVDANGEMILTGVTTDATFPVTAGALQTVCDTDAPADNNLPYARCGTSQTSSGFVTKISADGTSLVYSTYLHGLSGNEYGDAVAADASGDAIVLGATSSNDFPITSDAYQKICQPYHPATSPSSWTATIYPECNGFFDGGGTEYTVVGPNVDDLAFDCHLRSDGDLHRNRGGNRRDYAHPHRHSHAGQLQYRFAHHAGNNHSGREWFRQIHDILVAGRAFERHGNLLQRQ